MLTNRKITDENIATYGVQSQPDTLTGSATDNKKVFDNLIKEVVKGSINGVVDDLVATTGADEIGSSTVGLTSTTIQDSLTELVGMVGTIDDEAVKTSAQSLTELQKEQARINIGVTGSQVAVNSVNGRTGAVVLYTEHTGTLTAGQTSLTISDVAFTTSDTFEVFTDIYGVSPTNVVPASGSVTLTFKAQASNMGVKIRRS